MHITHGLLEGQVLQRRRDNTATAVVTGTCDGAGTVEYRIGDGPWQAAGTAAGGRFRARLVGLPAGGPYTINLRVQGQRDVLRVREVFCGDVWFMGGQSNMQGCGNTADAPAPHPMVRAFYMRDAWAIATEPMHHLAEAVDPVHNGYGDDPARRPLAADLEQGRRHALKGVSPALDFAIAMHARTGVPQGLVACAHGGTSMEQWSPARRDEGGASLYGAMLRRFTKLGQPVRGMLWYQGESDANTDAADHYTARMVDLVASVRRDMRQPTLPWLVVQIGRHIARDNGEWNRIQEQQRRLPERIRYLDVAPAIDLELDDAIHIGGRGQGILGRRLARLADRLAIGNRATKGALRVRMASVQLKVPYPGEPAVPLLTVAYDNVVGALRSEGLPSGFALCAQDGVEVDCIYKTRLAGNRVLIETTLSLELLRTLRVSYGRGRFPYCNITDAEGMSLPVMDRLPIGAFNAMPYLCNWQVARLDAGVALRRVTRRQAEAPADRWPATIEQAFVALPRPLAQNRDGLFSFQATVTATQACEVMLLFGADSPFVLWLNGRETLRDMAATNPCVPAEYRARVALRKGVNAITVAFDTRNSLGWGICLYFDSLRRKDTLAGLLAY